MSENAKIVKEYLEHVEKFFFEEPVVAQLIHPDVAFVEYPNLINKKGQVRNLAQARAGMEMGRKLLAWQKYEVTDTVEGFQSLFVEAKWSGQVAADIGHLKKDQILSAATAMRFDFKEGKIFRQVNYDCYEPF
jgi:hypothetical protein